MCRDSPARQILVFYLLPENGVDVWTSRVRNAWSGSCIEEHCKRVTYILPAPMAQWLCHRLMGW